MTDEVEECEVNKTLQFVFNKGNKDIIPIDFVFTASMNARVTETLVELRLTGGVMIAIKALTGETVDSIDTRSSIVTGVDCTLIDIDVTHFSCVGKKRVSTSH